MSLRRSARIQVNSQSIQPPEGDSNGILTTAPAKKRNGSGSAQLNEEKENGVNPPKAPARRPRASRSGAPKSTTLPKEQNGQDFTVPELPKTPLPKRRKTAATANPPLITPTPSAVALISSPANRSSPPLPDHHARPAEPHATNAPLQTPGGTRLTAYSEDDHVLESPVKGGVRLPRPTTTTENLLEEAKAHLLRVDTTGRLRAVIEKFPCRIFSPEGLMEEVDPFRSLTSGIIAQQVSGAAASSIKNKFIALFPDCAGFPTPAQVAAADLTFLRTAGLSGRKAEYIQGLAQKFASGSSPPRCYSPRPTKK
ncbi:3-methyladenine DNA glycosylase [Coniosporium tulheliwenetii]|uniref:3-methyladenine DNA glycosylase n=1 Tax=Coniosporium tulheliwenetii TaxID=3383036 RepID=A0ACC2Z4F8_9PEZI|nr:3-methyladenine DNA glycosylase [Cladosporium sp. JES 115]